MHEQVLRHHCMWYFSRIYPVLNIVFWWRSHWLQYPYLNRLKIFFLNRHWNAAGNDFLDSEPVEIGWNWMSCVEWFDKTSSGVESVFKKIKYWFNSIIQRPPSSWTDLITLNLRAGGSIFFVTLCSHPIIEKNVAIHWYLLTPFGSVARSETKTKISALSHTTSWLLIWSGTKRKKQEIFFIFLI